MEPEPPLPATPAVVERSNIVSREEYRKGLSKTFRLLNRTSKLVTFTTAVFIIYTRSLGAAYFAAGAGVCSLTVKVLKRVFREERPANTTYKITYGMPSTHAATISYFATYISLAAVTIPTHPSLSKVPRQAIALAPFAVVPTAFIIALSRIWLGHHTGKQVIAGSTVGVTLATGWLYMWTHGASRLLWACVNQLPWSIRRWIH